MERAERLMQRIGLVLLVLALAGLVAGCRQKATPTPQAAGLPVYHGELEVLAMPDAGRAPVLQAIDGARESIRLKIYLITDNAIVEALQRAAQRGVDVQVILEQEPFGGGDGNALAGEALAAAGVQVRERPGAFAYSHEKSLVVDDRRAYIMTHNLANSSFNRNREYMAIVEDLAVVQETARVFDADWERVEPDLGASLLVWSPVNSRQRMEALVDSAQVSLDVEHTSLLDERLLDRMVAASQRGVRVRVITPAILDPGETEFEPIKKLAAAGVGVRFLDDPYVHAKAMVVDGQVAMIGSQNLTANSLENNRELGIIFDDVAAVNRLARVFLKDWNDAEPWGGPEPTATLPAGGVLRWDQAADYIGQTVTVEGDILDTYDSGKVTFLNFDEERTFAVVIFAGDYPAFAQRPEDLYWRKRVRVTGQIELYQGRPEIIIESPEAIEVVADLLAGRSSLPAVTAPAGGVVSWQDAGLYLGQRLAVEGDVVRVYNSGKAAFLNFAEDYQGTFSVVIFAADFDQWSGPPEQVYLGQRVRVSGKIKEYKGAPEIIVESPEQIEIIGPALTPTALAGLPTGPAPTPTALAGLPTEPAPTPAALAGLPTGPAPTPAALAGLPTEPAPLPLVAWQNAAAHQGQQVVVEGVVVDSYKSNSVIFLNFSDDRSQFKAVIFQRDWSQWPQSPERLFLGQPVRVSGEIVMYEGAPEIIVSDPAQIQVVGQPGASSAPPLVAWDEAVRYEGQYVTVEGTVVDTYKSDRVIFLNFSPNRDEFKAVIFASAWPRWSQRPDELYYGQTLRITGQVKLYNGAPEIIVDGPEQIQVTGDP